MRKCTRCGLIFNDTEQYCPKCGCDKFLQSNKNTQANKPNTQVNKPNMQALQANKPNTQANKPNMQAMQANKPNMQAMQDNKPNENQNIQNNINKPNTQRRISKKERKSIELSMLYAMRDAERMGVPFDRNAYLAERGIANFEEDYDMTTSDWIKVMLIMIIPVFNIIFAIKNAMDKSLKSYKRSYYLAFIIYYLISLVLSTSLAFMLQFIIK